jgi:hypothetical protein
MLNILDLILILQPLMTRNRIGASFTLPNSYEDMAGRDGTQAEVLDWHTWYGQRHELG